MAERKTTQSADMVLKVQSLRVIEACLLRRSNRPRWLEGLIKMKDPYGKDRRRRILILVAIPSPYAPNICREYLLSLLHDTRRREYGPRGPENLLNCCDVSLP